ncbi:MAG: sugar ABC transporter permease [Spirochaetales bacterium]
MSSATKVATVTSAKREERRAYWVMILPAFVLYLFVMAFPTIISVFLSLSNYNGGKLFGGQAWGLTGFAQYTHLFGDRFFWNALANNMWIVVISVFGQIPLGFLFAYIIYRKLVKAPAFWQGVLYMPSIISTIVIGLLWQTIFSPFGPVAEIMNTLYKADFHTHVTALLAGGVTLDDAGIQSLIKLANPDSLSIFSQPVQDLKDFVATYSSNTSGELADDLTNLLFNKWKTDFMSQPGVAMIPVLFVILWLYTGFYLIIFLANLQKIDESIIEAAKIDGASEFQILKSIIIPAMSGVIVTSAILAISGSLKSFDLVYAMTGGGPAKITQILAIYMYDTAFRGSPNYPLANAISTVMVVVSFLLIGVTRTVEQRYGGKE